MISFSTAYAQLNTAQKQAVDTIEGPVMVVAGPGTGKTQLLSVRAGNILRHTDAAPQNILCLTFTESAADALRQRLLQLIGPEAHKIAVHTFHSFGTEIINQQTEYFYRGAQFRPADELSSFEVLEALFAKLPHHNPLGARINGAFSALRDVQQAISHLKRAGLTPDELTKIIAHNESFIAFAEPLLHTAFDVPRLTIKQLPGLQATLKKLQLFEPETPPVPLYKPLSQICLAELDSAVEAAEQQASTKPLSAWRSRWLERDTHRMYVFKDRGRNAKLRAVAELYQEYLLSMQEHELFDFEDMILRTVHALETFPELRYNLQEQYQYIMVDEFQDTNGAQARLLENLISSPASGDQPNIMVVGDDDQAIYAFQGAEIGTILEFTERHPQATTVVLTQNYRSTQQILEPAREVITQGEHRLETSLTHINKQLTPHNHTQPSETALHQFATPSDQYHWVADAIRQRIADGQSPRSIAILARNHRQLTDILPYLHQAGLQSSYERRNNVLEAEPIMVLTLLARTVVALGDQRYDIVDELLPQLLSYDCWAIPAHDLWSLSLSSYKNRKLWLEAMLEQTGTLRAIAELLIVASHEAQHQPLEVMLDMLLGTTPQPPDIEPLQQLELSATPPQTYSSPLRAHYFSPAALHANTGQYLRWLSNLQTLIRQLRNYQPDRALLLDDFVAFIDLHLKTKLPIVDAGPLAESADSLNLMTAHKAKGLEFDTVFILSCQDNVWGASARTKVSSMRFPHNLPIEPSGTTTDDCLRLFFVAMTRARQQLYLTSYQTDDTGRPASLPAFLEGRLQPVAHQSTSPQQPLTDDLKPLWQLRHTQAPQLDLQTALQPLLQTYQLSATHLNTFLDVSSGGPQAFLLRHLLHFPEALSRNAVFGSAIHAVLQRAHTHLNATGERRPTEDILHDFELQLQRCHLPETDIMHLFEQGSSALQTFLSQRYESFWPGQKPEYSFKNQGVTHGEVRLTGAIDLLSLDPKTKTLTITDYKTGRAPRSWQGISDYQKCKLHKYQQQLMLYKLLVEGARSLSGYRVTEARLTFVEPSPDGEILDLSLNLDQADFERFGQLLSVVWRHIVNLNLPNTSHYTANYKGMLAFEDDLLRGIL